MGKDVASVDVFLCIILFILILIPFLFPIIGI